MITRFAVALALAAVGVRAQSPTLSEVLGRAASYVATFERQLTGIAADETYVQSMGIPGRHGEFIPTTQRRLTATLVLLREGDEGYLEARDVREVDGVPVRDRAGSLAARAVSESAGWGVTGKMRLRRDNARHNIGDLVRTINTPLLALQVLRRQNQSRVSFSRSTERSPKVAAAVGDTPGVFRVSTDVLLGLLPPIEMHEHYRASGRSQTIVEASASYGPFHLISQAGS